MMSFVLSNVTLQHIHGVCPRVTVIDNGKPGPRPGRGGLVFNIMKGKVVILLQASERKCKARTIINKDYKIKI